jgi:hypothetical protein
MEPMKHTWSFSTVGGVKRVNLDSGADLVHLHELDQKLWTVLSCPVNGLEIDPKTLDLIDLDKDGKIRVPEILEAVKWITSILKNPDDLLKQESIFPLSAIDETTDQGRILLSSARILLSNLGKADSNTLSVEETSDTAAIFSASKYNGDGVITEDAAHTPELLQLLNEVMACVGSVSDRSAKQGISPELLDAFISNCKLYASWYAKAETNASILPFGARTEEAYLAYSAIRSKVDDYFIRCRLAAFDPPSAEALNLSIERVQAVSSKDLSVALNEIAEYPLARVEAGKPLPLYDGINPAWEQAMALFVETITSQQFPKQNSLSETEWNALPAVFADYLQCKSEKEGAAVETLGPGRVKAILDGSEIAQLEEQIQRDLALEQEANNIMLVDQLVRYYRDLFTLLKNFVTFFDFYSPGFKSIFQAGTLYIDQRSCNLCIKVSDMPKHLKMVSFSGMFLIYCECTSRSTNEKMVIVAALTNGDIDNLVEGRNALFYDRKGNDWDATVIKIIDNPISIRQAFWSPYRKVSRFIEKQVNKFAAEQDDKVTTSATKNIEESHAKMVEAPAAAAAPKAAPPPFDIGKFVGIFAAISLALGAIGTAIASVIAGFMGLIWWKMPLAIAGILLLISGPSMIMAYLKLRTRNLAPILDANGWAVNATIIVNIPFGNLLTHLAELPPGSKLNLNDPFTRKKRPFIPIMIGIVLLIALVFYLLWKLGAIVLPSGS